MADFDFLDDTDDSAIEELIAEVKELSVLEQISAINCSGFTDSVLPTDLDTRFQKLKSFPVTKPKSKPREFVSKKFDATCYSDDENSIFSPSKQSLDDAKKSSKVKSRSRFEETISDDENSIFSPSKQNSDGEKKDSKVKSRPRVKEIISDDKISIFSQKSEGKKKDLKLKSSSGSFLSSSNCSNSSTENANFPVSKERSGGKLKSRHGSFHSPLDSSSSSRSPSPPPKIGCFICSPKKIPKKKKNPKIVNPNFDLGLEWGKDDEILSDLGIFSPKEQKRILKQAKKEEEKINREAEKIVKWAKQASARMNISDIEDELSDHVLHK